MKKKTLLSFTLAIMATMWTTAMQAQEYYDLTIALVQVTSRN
ncbi:MAG: peptidase, partial [Prevotella nigrescens]|nr:peptidase [Prevotella nigrescens]